MALMAVVVSMVGSYGWASVLISDNFNRADSAQALGSTEQGYAWYRRDTSTGTADYAPGILNNTLRWNAPGSTGSDAAYMAAGGTYLKDYLLDIDYIKTGASIYGTIVNFRMSNPGAMVTDGGVAPGYALNLVLTTTTNLKMTLFDDYGTSYIANATVSSLTNHITLQCSGNNFKVYVNDAERVGNPALDYTDTSANPAKDASGYFTFSNSIWAPVNLDNFVVSTVPVPEPATMSLLIIGGLGVICRKKFCSNREKVC